MLPGILYSLHAGKIQNHECHGQHAPLQTRFRKHFYQTSESRSLKYCDLTRLARISNDLSEGAFHRRIVTSKRSESPSIEESFPLENALLAALAHPTRGTWACLIIVNRLHSKVRFMFQNNQSTANLPLLPSLLVLPSSMTGFVKKYWR